MTHESLTLDRLPNHHEILAILTNILADDPIVQALKSLNRTDRQRRLSPVMQFLFSFVAKLLGEPGVEQVLRGGWEHMIGFAIEQVAHHRLQSDTSDMQHSEPNRPTWQRYRRSLNQLPCSVATVTRRADRIAASVNSAAPILLLGDDDLLSLELARRGHDDVTVIDFDADLLAFIQKESQAIGRSVKVTRHDLNHPAPELLVRHYQYVVLDPPCTRAGLNVFLSAGLTFLPKPGLAHWLVCTHLWSQGQQGLREFAETLAQKGLSVEKVVLGFNKYAIPRRLRPALYLTAALVTGWHLQPRGLAPWSAAPRYFTSDAIIVGSSKILG